jgi:hypothetical protein
MSSHQCPHCEALCIDTEMGYISGCEHYPPDVTNLNEVQRAMVEEARGRGWYIEIPSSKPAASERSRK